MTLSCLVLLICLYMIQINCSETTTFKYYDFIHSNSSRSDMGSSDMNEENKNEASTVQETTSPGYNNFTNGNISDSDVSFSDRNKKNTTEASTVTIQGTTTAEYNGFINSNTGGNDMGSSDINKKNKTEASTVTIQETTTADYNGFTNGTPTGSDMGSSDINQENKTEASTVAKKETTTPDFNNFTNGSTIGSEMGSSDINKEIKTGTSTVTITVKETTTTDNNDFTNGTTTGSDMGSSDINQENKTEASTVAKQETTTPDYNYFTNGSTIGSDMGSSDINKKIKTETSTVTITVKETTTPDSNDFTNGTTTGSDMGSSDINQENKTEASTVAKQETTTADYNNFTNGSTIGSDMGSSDINKEIKTETSTVTITVKETTTTDNNDFTNGTTTGSDMGSSDINQENKTEASTVAKQETTTPDYNYFTNGSTIGSDMGSSDINKESKTETRTVTITVKETTTPDSNDFTNGTTTGSDMGSSDINNKNKAETSTVTVQKITTPGYNNFTNSISDMGSSDINKDKTETSTAREVTKDPKTQDDEDCDTDPGGVLGIKVESFSSESAVISWTPPSNTECLTGYSLESDVSILIDPDAITYTYKGEDADEDVGTCNIFMKSLVALYNNNNNSSDTVISISIPAVQELSVDPSHMTEKILILNWVPSVNGGQCAEQYRINVWNQDQNNKNISYTKENNHTVENVIGCMEYNFALIPMIGVGDGVNSNKQYTTEGLPTLPPNITAEEVGKTWAKLKVDIESYDTNMCDLKSATGLCEASKNNNTDASWIKWNVLINETLDKDQRQLEINVTELSPFTNYTCKLNITNVGGESDYSNNVVFRTDEDVTSKPKNLQFKNINPIGFTITWETPDIVPGILSSYTIDITNNGPLHLLPDECKGYPTNFSYVAKADEYEYDFKEGQPNYNYTIAVKAIDGAGASDPAENISKTIPDTPAEPYNVTHKLGVDNVTEEFTWGLPCNINGELQRFTIEINGTSRDNPKNSVNDTKIINDHNENEDFKYGFNYTETQPYYHYIVEIYAVVENDIIGNRTRMEFDSVEGIPTEPLNVKPENIEQTVNVIWDQPEHPNGIITEYAVSFINKGPRYEIQPNCEVNMTDLTGVTQNQVYNTSDILSFYTYEVYVNASTSMGYGNASEAVTVLTNPGFPETVRNVSGVFNGNNAEEEYDINLSIHFDAPCNTYGNLINYEIKIHRTHDGEDEVVNTSISETNVIIKNIFPESNYSISITSINEDAQNNTSENYEFKSPPGLPIINKLNDPVTSNAETAFFKLSKSQYSDENGLIRQIEFILEEKSDSKRNNKTFGKWDNNNIPTTCITTSCTNARQLALLEGGGEITFTIGNGVNVSDCKSCDNSPLKPDTEYFFVVRLYTSETYRDSDVLTFITDNDGSKTPNLPLILGLTFGLLAACVIAIFMFILWRKRKQFIWLQQYRKRVPSLADDIKFIPKPVSEKQFVSYYNELKVNYENQLKQQYTLLGEKSKDFMLPTTYAVLPENKRKNRYTNILPFDENRVKLQIVEDDEISSDYINASYIKGYSKTVEYICTQGPLPTTYKDFWKMVIQENVTVIVMVSQFIEQDKEKCYKYFPNNHEFMTVGEDMEVKCVTELFFGIYCIRMLQIRKGTEQRTVTHMQFLEWPDFGVPSDTENILQFCQLIREKSEKDKGLTVVHCSAGVGRTGTIICLDMLLQAIKAGEKINIFNTVLNLRKQRVNMVQTHGQYFYIHTCIKDSIENPISPSPDSDTIKTESIYENLMIDDYNDDTSSTTKVVTSSL